MKRILFLIIVLCLAAGAGAQELKLATFKGTAMYGPLFVKALKEGGIDVSIIIYDTQPEIIKALASKQVDGVFFLAQPIIARIPGAIMVPVRLHQTDFYGVATDPSIKVNSPGDLRKYSVGIVEGNMAHTAVTRGMQTIKTNSDREQIQKLAAGDFQVAVCIDQLALALQKALGIKLYFGERPLMRSPTFLALAPGQQANKEKILAALKAWQDNGQWEAEMKKLESR